MAKRFNLSVARPGSGGKAFWQNVGSLFVQDDGKMSIKLDAIPVGEIQDMQGNKKPFDGWIKVFEANGDRDTASPPRQQQSQQRKAPRDDLDDDIPF